MIAGDERGQTAAEYVHIVLVVVAVIGAIATFGIAGSITDGAAMDRVSDRRNEAVESRLQREIDTTISRKHLGSTSALRPVAGADARL
ncbi:MAG: hypothetical protein M3N47_07745 [Chloroflexota bacterium]|nr:hypothetical protein [Chloroflexota bacterium]